MNTQTNYIPSDNFIENLAKVLSKETKMPLSRARTTVRKIAQSLSSLSKCAQFTKTQVYDLIDLSK